MSEPGFEQVPCFNVKKLNGMFAIAVWDGSKKKLTIVRDRLGQKPLYYAQTSDGLYFGSELKCLSICDSVSRDLDHEAVFHYFTLGYIPHPWSIYKEVRQLSPAGRLVMQWRFVQKKQVNTQICDI